MTIKTRKTTQKSEYKKKLSWLRKNKTPKHILEVELEYSENDLRRILAISEELRIIRNTVVGLLFKNYKQMIRTKKYKDIRFDYIFINSGIYVQDDLEKNILVNAYSTYYFIKKM